MTDLWQIVAALLIVFSAWTLVQAAVRCFEPQDLDPRAQLYTLILAFITNSIFLGIMGVQVKGGADLLSFLAGFAGGYLTSRLAGYKDDYGYAVAEGSGWFLAPWGLSAAIATYGALNSGDAALAVGVLGMSASFGVGTGQLLFSWQANRRVRKALDSLLDIQWRFNEPALVTAAAGLPAAALVQAPPSLGQRPSPPEARTCPMGHPLEEDDLRFCTTCGVELPLIAPARPADGQPGPQAAEPGVTQAEAGLSAAALCPNGHTLTEDAVSFCTSCGSALVMAVVVPEAPAGDTPPALVAASTATTPPALVTPIVTPAPAQAEPAAVAIEAAPEPVAAIVATTPASPEEPPSIPALAEPVAVPVEAVVEPQAPTERCPNGHPLTIEGTRFCIECGVLVRCTRGHLIPVSHAAFCPVCGEALSR